MLLPLLVLVTSIPSLSSAQCTDPYEPNNSHDYSSGISIPATITGNITPFFEGEYDEDWYHFHMGANKIIIVQLSNMNGDFNIQLSRDVFRWTWVYSTTVATSANTGTTPDNIIYQDGPDADYYVRVYPASSNDSGCYTLNVFTIDYPGCTDNNEPNDWSPQAGLSGSPVTGRISSADDIDIFGFGGGYPDRPYLKIVLTCTDNNDYSISYADSHREENGNLWYYLYETDYKVTSDSVIAYYYQGDERGGYVVVQGGSHHNSCYQISAFTSDTPFDNTTARTSANTSAITPQKLSAIYPVPAQNVIYSTFTSKDNKQTQVTITDMSGKVVYKEQFGVVAGENKLEIPIPAQLADGVYILSNGINAEKFVLKR